MANITLNNTFGKDNIVKKSYQEKIHFIFFESKIAIIFLTQAMISGLF